MLCENELVYGCWNGSLGVKVLQSRACVKDAPVYLLWHIFRLWALGGIRFLHGRPVSQHSFGYRHEDHQGPRPIHRVRQP